MTIETQISGKYLSSDLSSPSTLLVLQVKWCNVCQRSKRQFDKSAPSLHPIPVSDMWCKVGIDLIELPFSSKGNPYVITLTDYLSKWVEAAPIPTKEACHVASFLYQNDVEVWLPWGDCIWLRSRVLQPFSQFARAAQWLQAHCHKCLPSAVQWSWWATESDFEESTAENGKWQPRQLGWSPSYNCCCINYGFSSSSFSNIL